MWRVHNISTLCKQCLPVSQRNRCIDVLFYSTSAQRKSSAYKSGSYEIGGIYSGVRSSTPQTPFFNSLKNVHEKRGETGNKQRGASSRNKRADESDEGEGNKEERNGRGQKREWKHKQRKIGKAKDGKDKEKKAGNQSTKPKMKKKKPEPFVIYKPPPPRSVEEEDEGGQYENTMFIKKLKSTDNKRTKEVQPNSGDIEVVEIEETKADAKGEHKQASGQPLKAEKKPQEFKNSMFKRPEPEEEDEDIEEGERDEEISEEVKQKIRSIGAGYIEKKKGDLFVQNVVQQSEDGMRMDRWAGIHMPSMPHSQLCKVLRSKLIYYSTPPETQRKKATTDTRLKAGDIVHVYTKLGVEQKVAKAPQLRLTDKELEVIRSWVIHKDDHILVINKPEGLPVQGGTKVGRHLDQLLHVLRGDKEEDPRLVHRLDRDTSGVLVLARTRQAATKLTDMFKNNKVTKIYWALISGVPKDPIGRINMPLEKVTGPGGEERIVPREKVTKTAKSATTDYNVVEELSSCSFVVLAPNTGRTHQLRVHCAAALGAHIVGDQKYGDGKEIQSLIELLEEPPTKLHLHARRIVFRHPFTNQRINVAAKLPPHMLQTWSALGLNPNYKEKLSEIAENPNLQKDPIKTPEKAYGKAGNVRRSIWKPKVSATPIRDMKMQTAHAKHAKKAKTRKIRKEAKKRREEEKKGAEGGNKHKKGRAAILKEQQYRAMRRARPVRRLAPKIKH